MSTLMNIDPWGFLDDLFATGSRTLRTMRARAAGRFPPVNVYLDDDAVIIDLELPGKTAKDVELTLEAQAVTITDRPAETTSLFSYTPRVHFGHQLWPGAQTP